MLAAEYPDMKVIVRPHPSESHQSWKDAARGFDNVEVLYEGHVYPWLMASEVMIHSGCTTGMEGYLLEKPVISYQPVSSEESQTNLPNQLSHNVFAYDELLGAVRGYLSGELKAGQSAALDRLIEPYISSNDDQLASDLIADKIDDYFAASAVNGTHSLTSKALGWTKAKVRSAKKRIDWANPNHKSSQEFNRHRFPPLEAGAVRESVSRFQKLLGRFDGVSVSAVRDNVFMLSSPPKS